jgi:hypothetical protein
MIDFLFRFLRNLGIISAIFISLVASLAAGFSLGGAGGIVIAWIAWVAVGGAVIASL